MTPTKLNAPNNEVLHTRSILNFDWIDRLRILCGKKVHHEVDTEVLQSEITVVETTTRLWVEPIIPRKPSGGYAPTEKTR